MFLSSICLLDFKNSGEIDAEIQAAIKAGLSGISFFANVDDAVLGLVERYKGEFI